MIKGKKLVVILLCIALAIGGIWAYKYMQNQPEEQTAELPDDDFTLESATLDLDTLTAHGVPIIIDFGADWCSPCRSFAPILEEFHDEVQQTAIVKYVDVDKQSDIAANFPVQVIPTQIFILGDGTPYVPSTNISVELIQYTDKTTGEHVFTAHQGGLTAEQLRDILADMGGSQ